MFCLEWAVLAELLTELPGRKALRSSGRYATNTALLLPEGMVVELVFAKKCVVPTGAAHVLQSLHMAEAFGLAGAHVHFYPGVRAGDVSRQAVFAGVLEETGIDGSATANWRLLPGNNAGWYGLRFRLAMAALLIAKPDAVFFARDISEALFLLQASAVLRRKIRFFFEMHEVLHLQPHNAEKARRLLQAERKILANVSGLVVISPSLQTMARDVFGFKKPVHVAPSAYSPALFTPRPLFTPERPWPREGEILQLVYLGRFHPGKGVENLVASMAFMPDNVHLRVIGGSPASQEDALREQAKGIPNGENRIVFTGSLPQKDAAAACDGAHIFVVPQETGELFFSPLKLFEAMALGVPILATPLDGFAGYAERGIVAPAPGTGPRDLAQGIMALAADPERALRLRENALAEAQTATWEARARRILDFCESVGR